MSPSPPVAEPPDAGVLRTHGARATEEVLFGLLDEVRRDLADPAAGVATRAAALARPVRVVVPSHSLRQHVAAALVRRWGATAGIVVQTHSQLAREVLERCADGIAGEASGDLAFEVLVRRLARAEPPLARGLDFLVDGYGAVAASVRDLLDAGLEPVLAEGADEALAALLERDTGDETKVYATRAEVERARALVRVAARVGADLEGHGAARQATLYARAADHLAREPERALPASRVLIHGYADATGLVTDLLSALMRHRGARLLLDAPPDPAAAPAAAPAGDPTLAGEEPPAEEPVEDAAALLPPRWQDAFSERLRERLAGSAGEAEAAPPTGPPPPARLDLFTAPGGEAEAREVALRVRALLDRPDGPAPETIGIVARELEPVRLAMRGHLATLGVPFSGLDARGSLTAAGRRARALQDLLRKRDGLPADRWLDATASLPREDPGGRHRHAGPFVDLRLAFYTAGAGTLRDVAELDLDELLGERSGLPLPVRKGFSYEAGDDDGAGEESEDTGTADDAETEDETASAPSSTHPRASFARRRYVPRPVVDGAIGVAQGLLDRLQAWRSAGALPATAHLQRLRDLLIGELGWMPQERAAKPVMEALDGLEREIPASLNLTFDELRLLLARKLEDAGRAPLGGDGGGVQVLSVVEARARTFRHLFVVGAHRGSFPRNVRPDPLLPDSLRGALAVVLPDVPRKRAGFDEERYLFAQLLSAAPHVTVSWQSHDDEGQPLAPSPLVERLTRPAADAAAGTDRGVTLAPSVHSPTATGGGGEGAGRRPRPAREVAVVAALDGVSRDAFGGLFAAAWEESLRRFDPASPARAGGGASASPAQRLAAARLRVLAEMAPDLRSEEGRARAARLGPYLGFLGPARRGAGGGDPRLAAPWVTHVENLAACPWQTFLRKVLRLEPTPDPLQALPGADPLLLGQVVHDVLERVVTEAGVPQPLDLAQALARRPVAPRWPGGDELDAWLLRSARAALLADGVPLPGLARALADRAAPLLQRARELEEGDSPYGDFGALGAEVSGEVTVRDGAGSPRALRFVADRVDGGRDAAGGAAVRLTDYKTGRPISDLKTADKRHEKHLQEVESGQRLQAVAYRLAARTLVAAAAAGSGGPTVTGRYLFLRPDVEEREKAEFAVDGGDAAMEAAFQDAVATLLDAWDSGAFFPRVVDPVQEKEPDRCQWCEVSEACVRGDSGARQRLLRWNRERAGTATIAAEGAHLRAWWLYAPADKRPEAVDVDPPPPGAGTASPPNEPEAAS